MVEQFYNIGKGIIYDSSKGTNGTKYDLRIIGKDSSDEIKAFSLSETEMNTVLAALHILDQRRFGTAGK